MGGRRQSIHSSAGTVTVVSSILWNDATIDESKQHIVADEDGTYILYCNINGDNPGIGNITADPMVVDAVNGDFRLQEGSPCIDVGDTSEATAPIDISGNDRVSGSDVDMGAYEYEVQEP